MYILYKILTSFLFIISYPFLLLKSIKSEEFRERLGYYDKKKVKSEGNSKIWIHAASVGEAKAGLNIAKYLIKLKPECSIIFSTTTSTSQNLMKKEISNNALSSKITLIYAPLDFLFSVKKAIKTFMPHALCLIETEIWPNLIKEAKKNGVRIGLLNGRISSENFKKYMFFKSFFKYLVEDINLFSMIKKEDAERIKKIGAEDKKIKIHGNVKFDFTDYETDKSRQKELEEILNIPENAPVFIAGSTRRNEPEIIIEVYEKIIKTLPETILIIAPRHIEKAAYIQNVLLKKGFSFELKTKMKKRKENIVILDTIGELTSVYKFADITFCGGTLVPCGGHNILEPVIHGKPVCYGPFTDNFSDAKELIKNTKGSIEVKNKEELYEKVIYFLKNKNEALKAGASAKAELLKNEGASKKHAEAFISIFERLP